VVPTGIDHGTVTIVAEGHGYQVTTLREDVATDGRRAVVAFGRDWDRDAQRRDFTLNALSVDAEGNLHDPIGGYGDLIDGRVRFIGEPERRIAEDRLRILRFFRFHAAYGKGEIDRAGLSAAIRAREGLRDLSAERIGEEMRRLVVAPRALETITTMQDCGILPVILAGVGYLGALRGLIDFETVSGGAEPAMRLAALAVRVEEDALRLTKRLRLANAERDRILAALGTARQFAALPGEREARRILYRTGRTAFRDGLALASAWAGRRSDDGRRAELFHLPERWPIPVFPLGGKDALDGGARRGPALGKMLKDVEEAWIAGDFQADETALRARLQQMIAANQ
jgi:tRNA nucleotidyltransferase/poly(A) polymerase